MPRTQDPGGKVYTVNPKGQIVVAPPPAAAPAAAPTAKATPTRTVSADGTVQTVSPDGTTQTVFPDGTTQTWTPEGGGTLTEWSPEGGGTVRTTTQDPTTGDTSTKTTTAGETGSATGTAPDDVESFLGIYGLPPDVAAKVHDIFVKNPDIATATQIAMAYIRGTPWYAQTYPGIKEGIARGLFGDEAGYRDYLNKTNGITRQYQGRDIGSDELTGYINQGFTPEHVGQLYQGKAFVTANRGDIQYTTGAFDDQGPLSETDLTALGNESAGIDSELGQKLQRRLNLAQQRLRGVFQGTLASPGLSTANGRLQATSLGGSTTPDVGA